jgi:thiol-disulfide isomerase/thioredoxin
MLKVYTQEALESELKKNKHVLALFYSAWCPYCVRFVPSFDKTVARMGFENVIHVLLDDYDSPLWDEYDIPAVPTVVLFENGKVFKRLNGQLGSGLSVDKFNVWIKELNKP